VIIYPVSVKLTMRRRQKMRKFMLMGTLVAVVVAALAFPALANERINGGDYPRFYDRGGQEERLADFWEWYYGHFYDDYYDRDDNDDEWWKDHDDRDDDRDEVIGAGPAVEQSFEQQAESGDVNQSFDVSNTGDNSNQCAGIQGVANTGNAQNQVSVIQYGSEAEDIEFEDSGASITVSPNSFTSCDQQVNQAASASG
jgi:hypothetical protein